MKTYKTIQLLKIWPDKLMLLLLHLSGTVSRLFLVVHEVKIWSLYIMSNGKMAAVFFFFRPQVELKKAGEVHCFFNRLHHHGYHSNPCPGCEARPFTGGTNSEVGTGWSWLAIGCQHWCKQSALVHLLLHQATSSFLWEDILNNRKYVIFGTEQTHRTLVILITAKWISMLGAKMLWPTADMLQ